jgi:hypothetical protein
MTDLQHQIEEYLLARGTWVSTAELETMFGVEERQLRQSGKDLGLITEFALSRPGRGFIHIDLAPTSDWIRCKNAVRREALARFRKLKIWSIRRSHLTVKSPRRSVVFEKDSDQAVLFEEEHHE